MIKPFQIAALAASAALSLAAIPTPSLGSDAPPLPKKSPLSPALDRENPNPAGAGFQRDAARGLEVELLPKLRPATAMFGTKVKDRIGQRVGRLRDLVLDLPSGRVIAALVTTRSRTQTVLVPAQAFRAGDKDEVVLDASRETFESAPRVSGGRGANALDATNLAEAFGYFEHKAPELPGPGSAGFCSAVGLLGASLRGQGEAPLGQLKDLVVILPEGRLVYLVIKPASGPDLKTALYVVPPTSLKAEAAGHALHLNASQAHFLSGPHFPKRFWAELVRPELAAAVQQHYGLAPAALTKADPTHQPVRARMEPPSAQAGARQSDEKISQAIMAEILRQAEPYMLRDLGITTLNGHVTLSGHPRTARLRAQILSAAQSVAGPTNVDNQLR